MRRLSLILISLTCFTVIPSLNSVRSATSTEATLSLYKRPVNIPFPKENPFSPAKEELGRMLFFDPRLSGSNWISCGTCHNPGLSWGDGLPKGIGHGMKGLGRRTPTLLNLAWGELMFWDGRAETLEAQALGPISSQGEMNLPPGELAAKVKGIDGYQALFEKAYPGEGVTEITISKAVATFERTIVSAEAPFDRWVKGDDKAVSAAAKRGFELFNGKGRCAQCHSGWRFTDDSFHDIGLAGDDVGRGKILPELDVLQHAFKTPTLRNADRRRPFMHDGSEKTLAEVIEFYNRGGDVKRPGLSDEIRQLNLSTQEKGDLLAFLRSLDSPDKATPVPMLPR